GLFTLMGGHAAAEARLDDLFLELNAGTNQPHFYIGNEPEHGTPWTYNFAGVPSKTQEVVRRIMDEEFNTSPGGLPGNDDLGATSAWLVWAGLGMYPAIPGTDILVLNGPRFPSAAVHLANGNVLTIKASGVGPDSRYIQDLRIDGTPTTRNWLRFSDISHGATLDYKMGPLPAGDWGTGSDDLPPSFGP
ncbi:MAG: glycoside hydrolase family 92 protein, partial [Deltaproteobacteria bacterium]|nr:glycoside hydrolase family 92 protein [Deltaproteobacteria bacterium]